MNNKNTGKSKNRRFQRPGLIYYCYLLIPLNELARKVLKINKLKNENKFIVIFNRSIQNAGKGLFGDFLHPDTPLASRLSGQALFLEGNLVRAKLDLW